MVRHFRELRVYRHAFEAAEEIFELSVGFPPEERFALTDQVRRSSRSVCANIAEARRKRRYPKHFVSKLSDADAEAAETQTWLEFARAHGYVSQSAFDRLDDTYEEISGGLVKMLTAPDRWCGPAIRVGEPSAEYDAATPTPPSPHTSR